MKKILFLLLSLFFIGCGGSKIKKESSTTDNNMTIIENSNPYTQLKDLENNSSLMPPSF